MMKLVSVVIRNYVVNRMERHLFTWLVMVVDMMLKMAATLP